MPLLLLRHAGPPCSDATTLRLRIPVNGVTPLRFTLLRMAKDLTRSQKTSRAYTLALVGAGSGVAAVVLLFVSGFGLFLLFGVIAVLCFLGFRRTVS